MAANDKADSLPAILLGLLVELRGEPLTVRHNPLQVMGRQEIARMLESEGSDLSELSRHESFRWFIDFDGVTAGSVSLKNISHAMGYAEIGCGIGQAHQSKGVATTAVHLLVQMCFRESPLRKLLAYVHDKNVWMCCKLLRDFWYGDAVSQTRPAPFRGRHFADVIILQCVRWYLRYSLTYRDLEEIMAERRLAVDHVTIGGGSSITRLC